MLILKLIHLLSQFQIQIIKTYLIYHTNLSLKLQLLHQIMFKNERKLINI